MQVFVDLRVHLAPTLCCIGTDRCLASCHRTESSKKEARACAGNPKPQNVVGFGCASFIFARAGSLDKIVVCVGPAVGSLGAAGSQMVAILGARIP